MLSVPTLAPIADVTLASGAPLHIGLDGFDADGDALSYTVASTNADLNTFIPAGNRSMKVSVQDHGDMVLELFEGRAPRTTARIIELAESGFYDGLIFHRVIDDFMIQGGDPLGTGTGGSGVDFDDEFHSDLQHTSSGVLSMAKSADDTNDSQFFITGAPTRHLDFNHSIFGFLSEGDDVREAIQAVETDGSDKPLVDVVIDSISIFVDEENGVLMLSADEGTMGEADVTVTVDDGNGHAATRTFHVTIEADTSDSSPYLLPIDDLHTTADAPVSFTIPATDPEGDAVFFDGIVSPANDDLALNIDGATGYTMVTPSNGIAGVHGIYVGVQASSGGQWDTQFVPVLISPAAPTDIDLLTSSDTGTVNSDNLTNLNNTGADTLRFRVGGVVDGAEVALFAGGVWIGQAVAAGESVIITTDGATALADGAHSITAVQTLRDQVVDIGNRDDTVDLAGQVSDALEITVDTTTPRYTSVPVTAAAEGQLYQYDVQTNEEAGGGLVYQLTTSPAGMIIDINTGRITWTPQQHGQAVEVVVRASDAAGNLTEQAFDVGVVQIDDPVPVIYQLPADTVKTTSRTAAVDKAILALAAPLNAGDVGPHTMPVVRGALATFLPTAEGGIFSLLERQIGPDTGLGRGWSRSEGEEAWKSELDNPNFHQFGLQQSDQPQETEGVSDKVQTDSSPVKHTVYKLPELIDAAIRLLMGRKQ